MVPIGPANSAGQYPTPASVQAVINTFSPYLAAETDSAGTGELKAAGVQSPIAGLIAAANNFYVTVNPAEHRCLQYIALPRADHRRPADLGFERQRLAALGEHLGQQLGSLCGLRPRDRRSHRFGDQRSGDHRHRASADEAREQ